MIVFLRSRQVPAPYCLLGAIGYGFYSQFVLWIYHRWVLGTMCWAPWILWALMRNRGKKNHRPSFHPLHRPRVPGRPPSGVPVHRTAHGVRLAGGLVDVPLTLEV